MKNETLILQEVLLLDQGSYMLIFCGIGMNCVLPACDICALSTADFTLQECQSSSKSVLSNYVKPFLDVLDIE